MDPVDIRANRIGREQLGTCTRRQLSAVGIVPGTVRRRIERGIWHEPLPGVIDLGTHPPSWRQRLLRVLLAAGPSAAVSHHGAAHLHGLLDISEPECLDVVVPRGRRARVGDVRLRTTAVLGAEDMVELGPFRVTSVARTLCDLAASVPAPRLDPMLWDAARRIPDLAQRMAAVRQRHPRAAGGAAVDRLLAEMHPELGRAESPLEVHGLLALRRAGAPPPEVQVVIRDPSGRFVARVDAAWPRARVAVEFDGAGYHDGRFARDRDAARLARLRELGWHVVVLRADDLRRPARCRRLASDVRNRLRGLA
jgi:hypothetical protein